MSLTKGNIVKGNVTDQHAIVLAVTKDGKRARIYVYGPDVDVWKPVTDFTVVTSGSEQCYKCAGSGLFYMGGMVLNGRYTGKTGECYGCQGKGTQDDADRLRCHYYWHRKVEADEAEGESRPLDPNPQARMDEQPKKEKVKIRSKKPATQAKPASHTGHAIPAVISDPHPMLIDCKGCGTVHRDDTMCPW